MTSNQWDALIVGGSSAGLSAALMLGRARRRVLVIDGGAPRNGVAPHMHGVLGHDDRSPLELLELGRDEVAKYGVEVRSGEVASASATASGFDVTLADGSRHLARRLLIATGLRDELPDIPGFREQWGTGVVVCPYCDGWESRDARIGVTSVHHAQLLRQWSASVTFFTNGMPIDEADATALRARGIVVEERPMVRLDAHSSGKDSGVLHVIVEGGEVVIDRMFAQTRPVPNDALLRSLGAETSAQFGGDWVTVDQLGRTSVAGLFAAGNVISPAANVPVSMAAGAMAGAGINMDLIEEETRDAVAAASVAA